MKSQNTKSTDELQNDVKSQLNRVEADMNAIQDRISPGQFIDDAIFYSKGRNIRGTIDHLKNNPVGTAFLSLGTILLMEDNEHHTMEYNARERAKSLKQSVTDVKTAIKNQLPHDELEAGTVPNKADMLKGKVANLKDAVQAKVHDLKEKIPKKEDIENRFGLNEPVQTEETNFSFTTEDTKVPLKDRAKETLSTVKGKANDYLTLGKEQVQNLDPLTFMALGAGLGALTGSALPVSEKEKELMAGKFDDKLTNFRTDIENAINECSNILKDLVISDVKDYNVRLFR